MNDDLTVVEGHPDLSRTTGHAIVNTNSDEYSKFLERKRLSAEKDRKLKDLEDKVESLENKLDTILDILKGK